MIRYGKVVINVFDCRAAVSRYVFERDLMYVEPASNWKQLEESAIEEVEQQGGAINLSGHYKCSTQLASRARFEQR